MVSLRKPIRIAGCSHIGLVTAAEGSVNTMRQMATEFHFLVVTLIATTICLLAPRESLGGQSRGAPAEEAVAVLERLAKEMRWLPPELLGPSSRLEPWFGAEHIASLKRLVQQARVLPLQSASAKDPTVRGLAGLIFGLSDDPTQVAAAVDLLKDGTVTGLRAVPMTTVFYGRKPDWDSGIKLTVSDLARRSLTYRWVGGGFFSGFPFDAAKAKEADAFFKAMRAEKGNPGEWVYRYRLAVKWGLNRDSLKKDLMEHESPIRGIAAAAVAAFVHDQLTEEEVVLALDNADKTKLKEFLRNKWRMATMTLRHGPYSKHQMEVRRVLLSVATNVFAKKDAQWVYNAADPKEWIDVYYIIAAAKLDPKKGVAWLKKAIEKDSGQGRRCNLLEALWQIGGEGQLAYIRDRYFAEMKPAYNAGGLQENLVERLGKSEGAKAVPLLTALIRDKRFRSLSWAPTRAFAKYAELVLGKQTAEVKRYLRVQHRMGRYKFEQWPNLRKEYPVDTKHVLMQTKAFQEYLQAELTKRK